MDPRPIAVSRCPSGRWVRRTALLLVLLTGAACGGDDNLALPADGQLPPEAGAPGTLPTPGLSSVDQPSVVALICAGDSYRLIFIDPDSGANRRELTFSGTTEAAPRNSCSDLLNGNVATIASRWRRLFDRTFTKVVALIQGPGDGSQHVGFIDESGSATDITALRPRSDFDSAPQDRAPLFSPVSDEIWYVSRRSGQDRLYSFDSATSKETYRGTTGFGERGFVFAESEWVIPETGDFQEETVVYNETTSVNTLYDYGAGVTIRQRSKASDNTTEVKLDRKCFPSVWVNAASFICTGENQEVRIVTLSADYTQVSATADLLPGGDRRNGSFVMSPDDKETAFLSAQGSTISVFRKAISGGEPHRLQTLPVTIGEGAVLLDWTGRTRK